MIAGNDFFFFFLPEYKLSSICLLITGVNNGSAPVVLSGAPLLINCKR